jgi:hypothetical protein
MKKLMCTGAAIFVLRSATFALAADVTGAWTGQAPGPNGEGFQLTFTFKQDGAKLTGTVAGPGGPPLDIINGKVDGTRYRLTSRSMERQSNTMA